MTVFLEILPELSTFNIFLGVWGFDIEVFRDASSKVNHGFIKTATMKLFVASMELCISFLHKSNPELTLVLIVSIKWGLSLRIVWDSRIYNNMLPLTIFEEIKYGKTILNTIVVDQILQKIWVSAEDQKGSKEPTVIKTK